MTVLVDLLLGIVTSIGSFVEVGSIATDARWGASMALHSSSAPASRRA